MKMSEIDRMNEVNNICNEMMRNAQLMERAAAADAHSRGRQVLGKMFGGRVDNSRVSSPWHDWGS